MDAAPLPTFIGIQDTETKKLHIGIKTKPNQRLAYQWGLPIAPPPKGLSSFKDKTRLAVGSELFTVSKKSLKRHLVERNVEPQDRKEIIKGEVYNNLMQRKG